MISTENYRNDYTGDGTTASYDFTFKIQAETHLQVVVNIAGAETTLVLNTDYSVEDVGEETGNILLLDLDQAWLDIDGFLDTGVGLTITRDIPLTQIVDFRNQSEYYPEGHEDTHDKQVMMLQQMQSSVDRCLKAPVSDPVGSLELPTADERANGYLGFDANGEPMVVTSAISSLVTVSAFMQTVLDDASATSARTTLGFAGTGGTAQAANIEADAVTTAKILDGSVTTAKLSTTVLSGLTEVIPAAADFIPIADTSDSSLNKKVLMSNVFMPPGAVIPFAGSSAPDGFLLCYGQAVSRSTYSVLFGVVSTTYGVGDGSTTFNLPDLRGRVAAGKDNMGGSAASRLTSTTMTADGNTLGATGGTQTHTLVTGEMPAHTHTLYGQGGSSPNNTGDRFASSTDNTSGPDRTFAELSAASTGGGGAHLNVQPTLILNYIIKH